MKLRGKKLLELILISHLGEPNREYRFSSTRRWRFDYAYPKKKIAIEYEGGTATKGRHVRIKGYSNDCEKYNNASLLGWRVFRFTCDMLNTQHKQIMELLSEIQ